MDILLFIPFVISMFICFVGVPSWIKRAKRAGLVGKNMNRYDKAPIIEAGGVIVISSFIIGVLSYIAITTFIYESNANLIKIFGLLCSLMIIVFIGFTDDILGWKIGLGKRVRLFLVFFGAIPLMVINAGNSEMAIPFFGSINFGLFYPLLLIPLGIIGASTTYNFLAGFNGLETGQGIIIVSFLSFIAYVTGSPWLALIGLIFVASLIVFYFYNKYPARILPGDTLTYPIGALIAMMAILGNFEKIAVFIFIPYIIETVLKLRGKLKKQSFGMPQKDGSLKMPYDKIYGLTHLSLFILGKIKKKVYENDVVYFIFIIQIILCLVALIIFKETLFI